MKKFKFFVGDSSGRLIAASNGYFDNIRHLPSEFTEADIQKENFFGKTIKKRAPKMRDGTVIKVCNLCGWSGRSGGAEYLYIKCIDGDSLSKIDALRAHYADVTSQIDNANAEIYKLAKDLIDEVKGLEKTRKLLQKQISSFDSTGEI